MDWDRWMTPWLTDKNWLGRHPFVFEATRQHCVTISGFQWVNLVAVRWEDVHQSCSSFPYRWFLYHRFLCLPYPSQYLSLRQACCEPFPFISIWACFYRNYDWMGHVQLASSSDSHQHWIFQLCLNLASYQTLEAILYFIPFIKAIW